MTSPHRLLLILLASGLGLLGYLWSHPFFFTPAKTLYARGMVEKEKGMGTDVIRPVAIKEAAHYFELALSKGYDSRDVFQNLYWCYAYAHDAPAVEMALSRGVARYPTDQEFWCRRAAVRLEQAHFELALQDFNKGLSLPANYQYLSDAFYGRGAAKYMLGQKPAAAADRTRAQLLSGDSLRTYADYCQLFN
jgi:tetratricopeptide (TPR) repeat protein